MVVVVVVVVVIVVVVVVVGTVMVMVVVCCICCCCCSCCCGSCHCCWDDRAAWVVKKSHSFSKSSVDKRNRDHDIDSSSNKQTRVYNGRCCRNCGQFGKGFL